MFRKYLLLFVPFFILLGAGCNVPVQSLTSENTQSSSSGSSLISSNDLTSSTISTIPPKEMCADGETYNAILDKCDTQIEALIQSQSPERVTIREVKPLPNLVGQNQIYAGIYIENAKISPIDPKTDYSTCPEQTIGQAISGTYHVFTYFEGKIKNDRILPLDTYSTQILSFPLKNTLVNNFNFFHGPSYNEDKKNELAISSLINFKDYTGDGKDNEFILYGEENSCGHISNMVVGINEGVGQIVFHPIVEDGLTGHWSDNFIPNEKGDVVWQVQCGDHGSDTDAKKLFSFDQKTNSYILRGREVKKCIEPQAVVQPQINENTNLSNDNYYTNSAGNTVHSPSYSLDDSVPAGATARCRDGTYSFSQSRRGICSHHGGVEEWL
jgi:hypothetical protein